MKGAAVEAPWRMLHRHPLVVLGVLFALAMAVVLWHNARTTRRLVESKALLDAALLSEAIGEVRTLYTAEVVETARRRGIAVTHDYREHAGAIPLPATFSMLLGQSIGQHQSGQSAHLYSPYPFPWRNAGGLRDDFSRNAWDALGRAPDRPYYRFEDIAGRRVLRYATADVMRAACTDCHNTHAQSPKRDWQVGDVRGVLEVRLPMHVIEAETMTGLRENLLLMLAAGILGFGILGLVVRRLRRTSDELEVVLRDLRGSHEALQRAHDDLVIARDDALAAVRVKNEFLGNVSHELRTPLNAILGYADLVREEMSDAQQTEHLRELDKITGAGQRLLGLIDDVLDASRLESRSVETRPETFDVRQLVDEIVAAQSGDKHGAAVELDVDCSDDAGGMHADRARLRRVLESLLSNAWKFTERGRITFRVTRETRDGGEWLRFVVADTGVGIPVEARDGVFEMFVQADGSAARRYEGLGLGLAIAARNVELMGGEIEVDSEPDRGSTFTVRVPAGA